MEGKIQHRCLVIGIKESTHIISQWLPAFDTPQTLYLAKILDIEDQYAEIIANSLEERYRKLITIGSIILWEIDAYTSVNAFTLLYSVPSEHDIKKAIEFGKEHIARQGYGHLLEGFNKVSIKCKYCARDNMIQFGKK